jgi:hypothetical protein
MSSGGRKRLGWAILTLVAPNKGPRTRASSVEVKLRRCPRPAVAVREDGAEWVPLFASFPGRPWRRGGWEAKRRLQLLRRETGAVLLALSSAFSLFGLAPQRRQWRRRKCWQCLVRVQGNFPPAACDDKIRPPTGPPGCRAPVPDASSSCGGVSHAAPPQVALFPGGWAAASARRPRRSLQESLRT